MAPVKTKSVKASYVFAAFCGACVITWGALDGRMYWHEGRLLYAVTYFSVSDLIAGQFNPNQLGGAIDTSISSGYHLTKILHLQLLELLTSMPSTAETQLIIGSIASFLAIAACGLCVRGTLQQIGCELVCRGFLSNAMHTLPGRQASRRSDGIIARLRRPLALVAMPKDRPQGELRKGAVC
jgi:hypothetical protein